MRTWCKSLLEKQFRSSARRVAIPNAARPCFEGLENRVLYAVFSGIVNGRLEVHDTNVVDTITLDHVGTNTIVNGASYADSLITDGVHVTVGSGVGKFDTVNVRANGITTFIDGQF